MADVIERLNAALEGRYQVERELGEGGMATVYLARDLRHDRHVAVKVLRPELAAVVGAERFLAEIKTTAALQHPHILPLHDSGEADSFLYYVMPYVEGESLRERIERDRQLPVDEAVELARKVADALQYAHEEGVIHRDVKPANILLSRGQPLVADFGIALAVSQAGGGRITETGLSLGTPHYMSPEQAAGERTLDRRSDVYALGCILYEMLAGQPPYGGPTAQSVLAQILTEQPRRVTDFRRTVPAHVASVVARALEKLPADRFESAKAFVQALNDPGFSYEPRDAVAERAFRPPTPEGREESQGRLGRGPIAAAGALVLLTVLAAWGWLRPRPNPAPMTVVRMAIPDSQAPVLRNAPRMDVSPDGRSMVYVGPGGGGMLWYLDLGQLDPRPLRGTDEAYTPVFAPDGRSVAYVTGYPGDVKVVGLQGEAPVTVLQGTAYAYGLSWSDDGWLYIADNESILRVRAQGGAVESVMEPDEESGETWRGWPHVLPGGRHLLFQTWGGSAEDAKVGIRDLETGEEAILASGLYPLDASTGHLVFTRTDGTVLAAPLDLDALTLTAEPAAVFGDVTVDLANAFSELAVSDAGTILYRSGAEAAQNLVWVDRDGSITPVDTSFTATFAGISISPDGRRVAAGASTQGSQSIYVKNLEGGPWRRVTFDAGRADRPVWVPGANAVSFLSGRGKAGIGAINVWIANADGTGDPRLVLDLETILQEVHWSPDGEWMVARAGPAGDTRRDILALHQDGDTLAVATTNFDEHSPRISPDGRWLAYVSDESGRPDVFVRPFPDVDGGKWQVSTAGGSEPVWSSAGPELFYRSAGTGMMTAARYDTDPSFAVLDRTELFNAAGLASDPVHQSYDVAPDGRRFLMARGTGGEGALVLVQNWFQQLEERLSASRRP